MLDMGALSQSVSSAMRFEHMDLTDGLIALAQQIHSSIAPWETA